MSDYYIRFDANFQESARTEELIPGRVMADYSADGTLIGIEVLGAFNCYPEYTKADEAWLRAREEAA